MDEAVTMNSVAHGQGSSGGLRERKKQKARRRIREVALRLFVESGYDDVSVEQIAEAAEVSRTTFFNYFATKEAVLTGHDPDALIDLTDEFGQRPPGEPLWASLTAVMLDKLERDSSIIAAQKHLQASSPNLKRVMQDRSRPLVEHLRVHAETRVADSERPVALLQINAMVAALSTAFDQWGPDEPFHSFIDLATTHINHLGRAFADHRR